MLAEEIIVLPDCGLSLVSLPRVALVLFSSSPPLLFLSPLLPSSSLRLLLSPLLLSSSSPPPPPPLTLSSSFSAPFSSSPHPRAACKQELGTLYEELRLGGAFTGGAGLRPGRRVPKSRNAQLRSLMGIASGGVSAVLGSSYKGPSVGSHSSLKT